MSDYKPRIQIGGIGPWACDLLERFPPAGGLELLAIFPSSGKCSATRQVILPDWISELDEATGGYVALEESDAIIDELNGRDMNLLLADLGDPFTRGCLPFISTVVVQLDLICPLICRGTGGPDESFVLQKIRDQFDYPMPIVPVCPSEENIRQGFGAEEIMPPIALGLAQLFRTQGGVAVRDVFKSLELARVICASGSDLAALAESCGRLVAGSKKPDFALAIACMPPALEAEVEEIPFLLGEYLPASGSYFQVWLPREDPDKRLLIVAAEFRDPEEERRLSERRRHGSGLLVVQLPEQEQPAADYGLAGRSETEARPDFELDTPAYLRRRAPRRYPAWDDPDAHPAARPEPSSWSADAPAPFPEFLRYNARDKEKARSAEDRDTQAEERINLGKERGYLVDHEAPDTLPQNIDPPEDLGNLSYLFPDEADQTKTRQTEEVDCSVFSPEEVCRGEALLIQAFIHLPAKAYEADRMAREFDSEAVRRGFSTLDVGLSAGEVVSLHLRLSGTEIAEADQSLRWSGRTAAACFEVAIPQSCSASVLIGRVIIARQTVPIGHVSFKLRVVSKAGDRELSQTPRRAGVPHTYRSAFVSYASEDRAEVLKRIQMLAPLGISFFYDVLSLDSGQRWESELYRHIEKSDVFFLFWSQAARRSEWVRREIDYAISLKGKDDQAPPEILPISLEGPPIPEPPDQLKHLHFSDRTLFFRQ